MDAMEGDALSLDLDQSQEEQDPLCEVLSPSPDSPKTSQVGLLTSYPWWKEQDEINSNDNKEDVDDDVRGMALKAPGRQDSGLASPCICGGKSSQALVQKWISWINWWLKIERFRISLIEFRALFYVSQGVN